MSRTGKKPIPIPAGVKVGIDGNQVTITGPKGELTRRIHPTMTLELEREDLELSREKVRNIVDALERRHGP